MSEIQMERLSTTTTLAKTTITTTSECTPTEKLDGILAVTAGTPTEITTTAVTTKMTTTTEETAKKSTEIMAATKEAIMVVATTTMAITTATNLESKQKATVPETFITTTLLAKPAMSTIPVLSVETTPTSTTTERSFAVTGQKISKGTVKVDRLTEDRTLKTEITMSAEKEHDKDIVHCRNQVDNSRTNPTNMSTNIRKRTPSFTEAIGTGLMVNHDFLIFSQHKLSTIKAVYVYIEKDDTDKERFQLNHEDTNIWRCVIVRPRYQRFSYSYSIEFYFTIRLKNYVLKPQSHVNMEQLISNQYKSIKRYCEVDDLSCWHFDIADTYKAHGYQELSRYILKGANEQTLKECIYQLENLWQDTELGDRERASVVKNFLRLDIVRYSRCFYLAFVAFLSLALNPNKLESSNFATRQEAKIILEECKRSTLQEITLRSQQNIPVVLKMLCKELSGTDSPISFMFHCYPFLSENFFLKELKNRESNTGTPIVSCKEVLSVCSTLLGELNSNLHENLTVKQELLLQLYRLLPLHELLKCVQATYLLPEKKEKVSECLKQSLNIAEYKCKAYFKEHGGKGDIFALIDIWKLLKHYIFIDPYVYATSFEDAILHALDVSTGCGCDGLMEEVLGGSIFLTVESQLNLLKKVAQAENKTLHSLFIHLISNIKFQCLPLKELENTVNRWFETLIQTPEKRKKPHASYICNLYVQLADIIEVPFVIQHKDLKTKLEDKVFEILVGNLDVKEIIRMIKEIESCDSEKVENLYLCHIQRLMSGEQDENDETTIGSIIQEICGVSTLLANSSVTFGIVTTLMDLTGPERCMTPLEALPTILRSSLFWDKVLRITGSKKDQIVKHPSYMHVVSSLDDLKQQILSDELPVKVLLTHRTNFHDFINLVSFEDDKDKVEKHCKKALECATELIQKVMSNIKSNLTNRELQEAVLTVKTYCDNCSEDFQKDFTTLKEPRRTSFYKSMDIFVNCCNTLKTVNLSKLFWNVNRDTLSKLQMEDVLEVMEARHGKEDNDAFDNLENPVIHTSMLAVKYLLDHLINDGIANYHLAWEPYFKEENVQWSVVSTHFYNADVHSEIGLIEEDPLKRLKDNIREALLIHSDYSVLTRKVESMKHALNVFKIDYNAEKDLTNAISARSQILKDDIGDKTLSFVCKALKTMQNVSGMVDDEDINILELIGESSHLVEFLQEVANEDLRNLIDAVEEYSEQSVQESTVSCFIEIKRFLDPLVKRKPAEKASTFFDNLRESSLTSGIEKIPIKIRECSLNVHCLRALYKNVANRGERTMEIAEHVVKKGYFHFTLSQQYCNIEVEYEDKAIVHSKAALSDLRSRALLLNKRRDLTGEKVSKDEYLSQVLALIDTALDVSQILTNLQFLGHFDYLDFNRKICRLKLRNMKHDLETVYNTWCSILHTCRQTYYFFNFIYSDQIRLLHQYFKGDIEVNAVEPIWMYIHPNMDTWKSSKQVYKENECMNMKDPQNILETLGKTIHSLMKNSVPIQRKFKIKKINDYKMSDIVYEGKLYIAALDDRNFVIKTVLALYLNTTGYFPEAHQILFCRKDTHWDEIELLIHRCVGSFEKRAKKELFCITNVDMLTSDLQSTLVQELRKFQHNDQYLLCIICVGNGHHQFLEQFSKSIMHPNPLTDSQMKKCFKLQWPYVSTYTSDRPGLGKTESIRQFVNKVDMGFTTLHISGTFQKKTLVERMDRLQIKPFHALHIDIGMIDNPSELDSFLFELITLKFVSAGTTTFSLSTNYIFIEIANMIGDYLRNSLPTITHFQRTNIQWENLTNYTVSMEINSPIQVVCHYVNALKDGILDQTDLCFTGPNSVQPLSPKNCKSCLEKHLSSFGDISFPVINIFLNVLCDQLKKLSTSLFFRTTNLIAMLGADSNQNVKSNLVLILIDIAKEFAARSVKSCHFSQASTLLPSNTTQTDILSYPKKTQAEELSERLTGMIQWEDSNHLLVLFHQDVQTISAIYRDISLVPRHIKQLIEGQGREQLKDFSLSGQKELQEILQRLTCESGVSIGGDKIKELSETYVLTPDNLLKMVLITLRMKAHIPIIIMGETGCGKTSLVRYLANICNLRFEIFSIHAGITEEIIITNILAKDVEAKKTMAETFCLFLDEINTCDHLGLISEIVCHHQCLGKTLAPNLVTIAACNPYRLREEKYIFTSGLQGKIKTDELSRLVYRVHPLPESMIDYIWDYGHLAEKDEIAYIYTMVNGLFERKELCSLFAELLTMSQKFVREFEATAYCVSLRDVERCKQLVTWFITALEAKKKLSDVEYRASADNIIHAKAIILSLALCYHSRFSTSDNRKSYRINVSEIFMKQKDYEIRTESDVAKVILDEQTDILNRMDLPKGTAKNTALQENVFVIFVCILNRIPVFVVGKPGCSKSLSIQLIRSNLRGKDSRDQFFKTLPQLYCISFQGSESSTSDGIIKVFDKAKEYRKHNKIEDVMPVVILDEIGLAEISCFNPLKVLHSLLEPEDGMSPDVAVVGISNWALDAAKMNRAIHLSRPDMDQEELYQTGVSISKSLLIKPDSPLVVPESSDTRLHQYQNESEKWLRAVANAYYEYSQNGNPRNFHGLRDYYALSKYTSEMLIITDQTNDKEIASVLLRGLLGNFGGLPLETESIKNIFTKHLDLSFNQHIPVLDLIQENIHNKIGRHLMLITNGDAIIPMLEQLLQKNEREYVVIFGSQFEEDMIDDYNYRILSRIILCMEQGFVLILKDLENIYGSLYDMLNQNYTVVGQKNVCRVALGAYSNPMCQVDANFKCIVLVEETKLDESDPPFLSRFEKQYFRFSDILDQNELDVINNLDEWITDLCYIPEKRFSPFDAFPVYSNDMLATLVLHMKSDARLMQESSSISKEKLSIHCIECLLKVATPEAIVRIENSGLFKKQPKDGKQAIDYYLGLPINDGLNSFLCSQLQIGDKHKTSSATTFEYKSRQKLRDHTGAKSLQECETSISNKTETKGAQSSLLVVFTHTNIHVDISACVDSSNFQVEKIWTFKSEKHLHLRVQSFFQSDKELLILQCNGRDDASHLLLVKSVVENCKANYLKTNNGNEYKHVCIIVHIERKESQQNSVTQLNFLSDWEMVTLDSIEKPQTKLSDLVNVTVYEVIHNRRPLSECIKEELFWAFTRIQYTSSGRSFPCMKDLYKMQKTSFFLQEIENVIMKWIKCQSNCKNPQKWHVDIACDTYALNSSTTFMSALERCILSMVKHPLAMFIYKLEEANALSCIFEEDQYTENRRKTWSKIIYNPKIINLNDIKEPVGPECYTCTAKALTMKMPFSQVVITKVEDLKNDYMSTLRAFKTNCGVEEEEEMPKELFEGLVSSYQYSVKKEVLEIGVFDYEGIEEDYIHDFCNFISCSYSNTRSLDEENRVAILIWAISKFADLRKGNFGEYITKLHAAMWTYSTVILSIFELICLTQDVFDNIMPCSLDEIEKLGGVLKTCITDHQTSQKDSKRYHVFLSAIGSRVQQKMYNIPVSEINEKERFIGVHKEDFKQTLEDSATFTFSTSHITVNDDIEITTESSSIDDLIQYICNNSLPTTKIIDNMNLPDWKHMLSKVLPLVGKISDEPTIVHGLRFCSDIATILVIPFNLPKQYLTDFGNCLQNNTLLESKETTELLRNTINELHAKYPTCRKQLQRIICLYVSRSVASNPNSGIAMRYVLEEIAKQRIINPDLWFFGPVLGHVLETTIAGEEDDLFVLLLQNQSLKNELLKDLNFCVSKLNEDGFSNSHFYALLVDVLEKTVFENVVTVEILRRMETSDNNLLKTMSMAKDILMADDCSLKYLVAIAFLKKSMRCLAMLIEEDQFDVRKHAVLYHAVGQLLLPANHFKKERSKCLLLFFLKCLLNGKPNYTLSKVSKTFSNIFPLEENLDWNSKSLLLTLEFNPLSIHNLDLNQKFHSALAIAAKDITELQKFIEMTHFSPNYMFSFTGVLVNRYCMKTSFEQLSDTERDIADKILQLYKGKQQSDKYYFLEYITATEPFGCDLFNLSPNSSSLDCQMTSVLLHLFCILTVHGSDGNVWLECIKRPQSVDTSILPGFAQTLESQQLNYQATTCSCGNRFVSKFKMCPSCTESSEKRLLSTRSESTYDKTDYMPYHQISPITQMILQFVVYGCFFNSVAFSVSTKEQVNTALDFEVGELQNRLISHWNMLQSSLGIPHRDLCGLFNILLLKCMGTLTQIPNSHCKTESDKQAIEVNLIHIIDETIKNRFQLLIEYRKKINLDDTIECQLDETTTVVESEQQPVQLLSIFRYTDIPTRQNLYAELFVEQRYKLYPFLHMVLSQIDVLPLIQSLIPLLRWHFFTVTFGSYSIRKVECKETSIGKFMTKVGNEKASKHFKEHFRKFETAWKELRGHEDILKQINCKIPSLNCMNTATKVEQCIIMNFQSPLYVIICTLVEAQNTFLDRALNAAITTNCPSINFLRCTDNSAKILTKSLMEITEGDIINYQWSDEVLKFSQCDTKVGHGKLINYDLVKIEMELAQYILFGKAYIEIPVRMSKVAFTDELFQNSVILLQELGSSIQQEPLSPEMIDRLDKKTDKDTSEMLTLLGMSLSLLKKTGGNKNTPLIDFLEQWKDVLTKSTFERLLPEPKNSILLCHIVSFYEWLETLNGETVLDSLDYSYRTPMTPDSREKFEATAESNIKCLESLGRTLKIFVHRCLSIKDNTIELDRPLLGYIIEPSFWQDGVLNGENVVGNPCKPEIKLGDMISDSLMVEHIYDAVCVINELIEPISLKCDILMILQKDRQNDYRLTSISSNFKSRRQDSAVKQIKKKIKAKKGQGIT